MKQQYRSHQAYIYVALLFSVSLGAGCSSRKLSPTATELTVLSLTAGGYLSNWQESREPKTGIKQLAFFLASKDLSPYFQADAKRDITAISRLPAVEWAYGFLLVGGMQVYRPEDIQAFRLDGHEMVTFSAGGITIDQVSATVVVSLHVQNGSKSEQFVGNGRYSLPPR